MMETTTLMDKPSDVDHQSKWPEGRDSNDIDGLLKRMSDRNFLGEYLNDNPDLLNMII